MVGMNIPQEHVHSIVKRTMKEADEDKDDFISLEEFKKVNIHVFNNYENYDMSFTRHLEISMSLINWVSVFQEVNYHILSVNNYVTYPIWKVDWLIFIIYYCFLFHK